jgi:TonB family protein
VKPLRASAAGLVLLVGLGNSGTAGAPAGAGVSAAPPRVQDLGASGPSVAERLAEIRRRVQDVAVYPELARLRGVEGEAQVGFEIGPSGHPTRVVVERSSGSLALDRAAERAVTAAGVLPYVVGRIRVPVRFALVEGSASRD